MMSDFNALVRSIRFFRGGRLYAVRHWTHIPRVGDCVELNHRTHTVLSVTWADGDRASDGKPCTIGPLTLNIVVDDGVDGTGHYSDQGATA